jgi:hypothetical protein
MFFDDDKKYFVSSNLVKATVTWALYFAYLIGFSALRVEYQRPPKISLLPLLH